MMVACLALLALGTSVLAHPHLVGSVPINLPDDVITSFYPYDQTWTVFKKTYGKVYNEIEEEKKHYDIFLDNLRMIEKHNVDYVNGKKSHYMGINMFTDMTPEEWHQRLGLLETKESVQSFCKTSFLVPSHLNLPSSVDWTKRGYVTPVKNQGQCGSCWAFSTTGSLEGQHFRKTGRLASLSEQQLMDCSSSFGNQGCNGGVPEGAFAYIKVAGGIESESAYPYHHREGKCAFNRSKVVATVSGCVSIPKGDEKSLQRAVAAVGPISVAINATALQSYKGGVLDDPDCSWKGIDHAILVVGYGTYQGKDYWLIKNSWGAQWGLDGFAMMSRNKGNQCGIASMALYPLV